MSFLSFFVDPSFLFTFGVNFLPIIFFMNDEALIIKYLTNEYFIGACIVTILSEIFARLAYKRCSYKNLLIARWFLLNATFFHFMYDPIGMSIYNIPYYNRKHFSYTKHTYIAGLFNSWSIMSIQYRVVDPRFNTIWEPASLNVNICCWLELCVMAPLCFYLFFLYRNVEHASKTQKLWVYTIDIITSLLQIIGCWIFYGPEILLIINKSDHVRVPIDYKLEFTLDYIINFWFGFAIVPWVWILIPGINMTRSYNSIKKLIKTSKKDQ